MRHPPQGASTEQPSPATAGELVEAARRGDSALLRRLLAAGAPLDCVDAEGETPLMASAAAGHLPLVQWLLENHVPVDQTDLEGRHVLTYAALGGSLGIVQLLVEAGGDPSADSCANALFAAATRGHEAVFCFLEPGVDTEEAELGRAELVRALLRRARRCPESLDEASQELLAAVAAGDLERVLADLEGGVDVDAVDADGNAVLHHAVLAQDAELVRLLVEAGADLDPPDEDGMTPLLLAGAEGDAEVVRALSIAGAALEARDEEGRSPLDVAIESGNAGVVAELIEQGADLEGRDADLLVRKALEQNVYELGSLSSTRMR